MVVNLSVKSFSFFKILTGSLFLLAAVVFPVVNYVFVVAMVVGKAHTLGAWIAMWRAGKFNWPFILWGIFAIIGVSFLAIKVVSLSVLALGASILFAFHFIFDELELQEEKGTFSNVLSSVSPFAIAFLYLLSDFFNLAISFKIFVVIAALLAVLELFFIREINWFFLQTKVLTLFILYAMIVGISANSVMYIFLVAHYFFWFIYPVYKLHKYNRKERDGFIMLLLVLIAWSVFVYSVQVWNEPEFLNATIAVKTFLVATIAHILTTAPFTYVFGVAKPR